MGSLNRVQVSILIGSLLGDGSLRKALGKLNALFEVNHTFKQKDYVDWKYEHFSMFVLTHPKARKGNGNRIAYRFTTQSLSIFTEFYNRFYSENRKFIPNNLQLDPLALAVWYMDDGCKSRTSVYLNTQQFGLNDQLKLLKILKEQFKLNATLNKDKIYYRIRITTESTKRFKEIIKPFVIPSMKYKLDYDPVTTDSKEETYAFGIGNTPSLITQKADYATLVAKVADKNKI